MRKYAAIIQNALALAVPTVLNPVISFVLVLVISRYMGVEGLGKYSLVLSYLAIFGTLASLGLGDLCVREVAKDSSQAHVYLVNGTAIGALSSVAAIAAMNAMVFVLGYESDVMWAAVICSPSILASTAIVFMEAIFRSLEKSHYVAVTFVAENIVRVGACVWLLLAGYGVIPVFTAILASRIFGMLLMFALYVRAIGFPRAAFDRTVLRFLASEAPTFASIAIFSTIHLSVDQIMLSKLQDLEAVGLYSSADRLLSITKTVPVAFSSALLTFFSKEATSSTGDIRKLCIDSLRFTAIAVLPVVVGTCVLADRFITLLYGAQFEQAGDILRVHIISLIPFSTVFILAQVLIATNNQRVDLAINIVGAVLNIVLNFALIPYFGAMGAVAATLTTIVIFNQAQYWYIQNRLFPLPMLGSLIKPLGASVLMGGVTFLLRNGSIMVCIAGSVVVYVGLITLMKALRPEEIAAIWRMARLRKGADEE